MFNGRSLTFLRQRDGGACISWRGGDRHPKQPKKAVISSLVEVTKISQFLIKPQKQATF